MAYANLYAITCTDKEEFFQRFRDFLCKRNGTYDYSTTGIGWTLHDSSYATDEDNCAINDYFVVYSAGESTDEDMYFKITWTSGYITIRGYQSWDATTHAGSTNSFAAVSNFYMLETGTYVMSVYGDLTSVLVCNQEATNDFMCVFGKLDPAWENLSDTVANCSSALSSGSDVSITVDAVPSNWAVGKEIFIRTTHSNAMATVKIEKITIKTLVGLVITADLSNAYTANSKLSDHVGYFASSSNQGLSGQSMLIGNQGTVNQSVTEKTLGLASGSFDPGPYEDRFFMLEYFFESSAAGLVGKLRNVFEVPTFVAGWAEGDVIEEDDGTEWRAFKFYNNYYGVVKEV